MLVSRTALPAISETFLLSDVSKFVRSHSSLIWIRDCAVASVQNTISVTQLLVHASSFVPKTTSQMSRPTDALRNALQDTLVIHQLKAASLVAQPTPLLTSWWDNVFQNVPTTTLQTSLMPNVSNYVPHTTSLTSPPKTALSTALSGKLCIYFYLLIKSLNNRYYAYSVDRECVNPCPDGYFGDYVSSVCDTECPTGFFGDVA